MKKILCSALATLCTLTATISFTACHPNEGPNVDDTNQTDLSLLSVKGADIVDSNDNVIYLRGVNTGGLGVIEQWMNGFVHSRADAETSSVPSCKDHYTTSKVFIERFGKDKAKELWKEYQNNWFNEYDFAQCADMGMNVLRIPFTYMNVDFDAVEGLEYAGKSYDFTMLDEFVETAAKYNMYTILDLHGAYGSQNGKDHSGESQANGTCDFYTNGQKQELTLKLWKALAEHFKDNDNVAAYDILNEPANTLSDGSQTTTRVHWDYFDKIYDEIRSVDKKHIVMIESCWEGNNLPQPSEYGWENVSYSFHHYTSTTNVDNHTSSWNSKIDNINSQEFGVPIYMGEFQCYEPGQSWDYSLDLMNANGWHWTSWTYKINSNRTMPWGIYNIQVNNEDKVNAHTDSYETIIAKFKKLSTKENATPFKLWDDRTVYEVMKEHCTSLATPLNLEEDNYYFRTTDYKALKLNGSKFTEGNDKWDGQSFFLLKNKLYKEDGSVQFRMNNQFLAVDNSQTYLTVTNNQNDNSTRFFLLETEEGFILMSYASRAYVRYDSQENVFKVDATRSNATVFFVE